MLEAIRRFFRDEHSGWLVAPALIAGLALRLFDLGTRNTWYDEISSILFAEKDLATIIRATAADTMPPLYYFLLHYWLILGNNLLVARSLSVVLSLGVVAVAFVLARRLFGPRVAFIAAFLVAVNPFQVYHGQEVRMYSLLGLSQLLAIYFLLRCIRVSSFGNWVGFILSQTVAMYTHNAAFLSLVTLDCLALGAALLSPRSVWGPKSTSGPFALIKALAVANLAIVVLFLPWLVYLPGQLAKVTRAFWTETPGVVEIIRSVVVFTFNLPGPTPWSLPIFLSVSLLLCALTVYSAGKALVMEGKRGKGEKGKRGSVTRVLFAFSPSSAEGPLSPLVFAFVCFVFPIILAVLVSLVRPIYVERVLITPAVMYLILLAWMGERLRPRFGALVLFSSLVLLSAWSLATYYQHNAFPRVAFTAVADYLKENFQPGDAIVHDNKLTFFPSYYFKRDLPQLIIGDPDWSGNDTLAEQTQVALGLKASTIEEAAAGKSRVWFVVFDRSLTEATEQGRTNDNVEWLSKQFRVAGQKSFGDLSVYLYVRSPVP